MSFWLTGQVHIEPLYFLQAEVFHYKLHSMNSRPVWPVLYYCSSISFTACALSIQFTKDSLRDCFFESQIIQAESYHSINRYYRIITRTTKRNRQVYERIQPFKSSSWIHVRFQNRILAMFGFGTRHLPIQDRDVLGGRSPSLSPHPLPRLAFSRAGGWRPLV